jgi:TRAP-type C4-dicarboxylate transport system permease small subunit
MLKKIMDGYCAILKVIMVACMVVMVAMVFGNVVLRYGFNSGIAVSEEVSRWLFLWVIFMGATVAVYEKAHMGTDMLVLLLPPSVQKAVSVIAHALMLYVTWLMFEGSLAQTRINWDVEAPVTGLSMAWMFMSGLVFAVSSGLIIAADLWLSITQKPARSAT